MSSDMLFKAFGGKINTEDIWLVNVYNGTDTDIVRDIEKSWNVTSVNEWFRVAYRNQNLSILYGVDIVHVI